MKSNELRIGNHVWDDYSGEMIVSGICLTPETVDLCKTFKLPRGRYSINNIQPIPLTEEWLVKFEFHKAKMPFTFLDGWAKSSDGYFIGLTENERGYRFANPHFDLVIEYVHQLQNLYFALTGEELKKS